MNPIVKYVQKQLFGQKGAIANRKAVDFSVAKMAERLSEFGFDPRLIQDEKQLVQILNLIKFKACIYCFSSFIKRGSKPNSDNLSAIFATEKSTAFLFAMAPFCAKSCFCTYFTIGFINNNSFYESLPFHLRNLQGDRSDRPV